MTIAEDRPDVATLAIDAGQTNTKIRIEGRHGTPLELVYPGVRTSEPLLPQLGDTMRRLFRETERSFDIVAVGVSGLTSEEADAARLLELIPDVGVRTVLLAHDSVTSFLGTLGDAHGAVIAAGTGVVTLGVGRTAVARVDGWGNIMGDAGSAYWIGREALEATMRAHDGRGAPTSLEAAVRQRWPQIEDAYVDLQADPDRVRIVASFAQAVTDLAGADVVAARICLAAARELSQSVVTALRRVADPTDGPESPPLVSAIGGVFRSTLIRTRFEQLIAEAVPNARLEAPHGTGLDGAAALPGLLADHPLRALISTATSSPYPRDRGVRPSTV